MERIIIATLAILTLTTACHSINGISKKAILRGLETPKPNPQHVPSSREVDLFEPVSSAEIIASDNSLAEQSDNLVKKHSDNSLENQNDASKKQTINEESTTETINHPIPEDITNAEINSENQATMNDSPDVISDAAVENNKTISAKSTSHPKVSIAAYSAGRLPKIFNLKLLHEPVLSINEPGQVKENVFNPASSNTFVLSMKPPAKYSLDNDGEETEVEEDTKINADWGGSCGLEDWKKCYNITVIGNPTEVHPLHPLDRKKNRQSRLDCFDTMEMMNFPWLCLRSGWTVNRCHLLCMSTCNRDLLRERKWDYYVLHEGACKA